MGRRLLRKPGRRFSTPTELPSLRSTSRPRRRSVPRMLKFVKPDWPERRLPVLLRNVNQFPRSLGRGNLTSLHLSLKPLPSRPSESSVMLTVRLLLHSERNTARPSKKTERPSRLLSKLEPNPHTNLGSKILPKSSTIKKSIKARKEKKAAAAVAE